MDKLEEKAKTLTYADFKCPNCDTLNSRIITWNVLPRETEHKLGFFCEECGSFQPIDLVRLEDTRQEIGQHGKNNEALATVCANLTEQVATLERERDELKQKLREKAIHLLMLRAGGKYRMFEAGMLYQCLTLLGMQEFTRHEQVNTLDKTTCHYLRESDAKRQFERLLKH